MGGMEPEVLLSLIDGLENKDEQSISDHTGVVFGIQYLRAFGYLAHKAPRDLTLGDIHDSLRDFQELCGLEQNGHLDLKTVQAMVRPRCGVPDRQPMRMQAKGGSIPKQDQWNKRKLTWAQEKTVPGLSKLDQADILEMAWKHWSDVCDLTFERVSNPAGADITISIGRGKKDDFDGPSGTLAWAYLPIGDDSPLTMRFDLDEVWVKDVTDRGILMLNVATHEFGHLLGLDHSKIDGALMSPFYNPAVAKPQDNDDIPRIRALYGPDHLEPATQKPTPPKSQRVKVSGELTITWE